MKKNGSFFLSIIDRSALRTGLWDPNAYREKKQTETLGFFASVQPLKTVPFHKQDFVFAPIEYRHIGRGHLPSFILERSSGGMKSSCHCVGERALLFGTMRAYLGNVAVTPLAEWIGQTSPFLFGVKSEFVQIVPKDGLVYFWWAYLQQQSFLHNLPIGTGGTRPRLHGLALSQLPVEVPAKEIREQIHLKVERFASSLWSQYISTEQLLESIIGL